MEMRVHDFWVRFIQSDSGDAAVFLMRSTAAAGGARMVAIMP